MTTAQRREALKHIAAGGEIFTAIGRSFNVSASTISRTPANMLDKR